MYRNQKTAVMAISAALLLTPSLALAQATEAASSGDGAASPPLERIKRMERDLQDLKAQLRAANEKAEAASAEAEAARERADAASKAAETVRTASRVPAIEKIPDTIWRLAGYAEAGLVVSDAAGQPDTFSSGKFNPAFQFQYKDLVLFESEAEISVDSDGETELELEYSQFDVLLHDYATLVVGKYLSPVGQFQERLHPGWINKMPDAPAGFGHDGVQPASDVGVQLRGGVPVGDTVLTYVLAVGNGPRVSGEGGVELEGFGSDDNDNKSISGRIGFLPVPWLEVGASFLTSKVSGEEGTVEELDPLEPTNADFNLWGVDAAYTRGSWDVRFEYLNAKRDRIFTALPHEEESALGLERIGTLSAGGGEEALGETEVAFLPDLDLEAWYAQAAYRLSGLTDRPVWKNFEPVVRYGEFHIKGLDELREEAAEDRFDVGLNYWLAPSIVLHGSVQWRDFKDELRETETRYQLKFAYGF